LLTALERNYKCRIKPLLEDYNHYDNLIFSPIPNQPEWYYRWQDVDLSIEHLINDLAQAPKVKNNLILLKQLISFCPNFQATNLLILFASISKKWVTLIILNGSKKN
jgi:hypothetical protein